MQIIEVIVKQLDLKKVELRLLGNLLVMFHFSIKWSLS